MVDDNDSGGIEVEIIHMMYNGGEENDYQGFSNIMKRLFCQFFVSLILVRISEQRVLLYKSTENS